MLKKILTWPNNVLKLKCQPVAKFDDETKNVIIDMVDTCNINFGAGIAAPQIGVSKKIVVIKAKGMLENNISPSSYNEDYMVLINPVIEVSGEKKEWTEACLSLPDVKGKVERYSLCSVVFSDENGETKRLNAGWPFSGVLQHEIDHLDGKLYHERMDKRKRRMMMWEVSRIKRKKEIAARKRKNVS